MVDGPGLCRGLPQGPRSYLRGRSAGVVSTTTATWLPGRTTYATVGSLHPLHVPDQLRCSLSWLLPLSLPTPCPPRPGLCLLGLPSHIFVTRLALIEAHQRTAGITRHYQARGSCINTHLLRSSIYCILFVLPIRFFLPLLSFTVP
jgi:hypothetical protein